MNIFDINNPPVDENNNPVPSSDLDSDLSRKREFTIAGGKRVEIAPGDWVDIDPNSIAPDPDWGFSFQVCGFDTVNGVDYVLALVKDANTGLYAPSTFSPSLITNNFRRTPEVEE